MNSSLSKLLPLVRSSYGRLPCYAFDIGAHHGEFSKFLIQTGLFAQVFAFEPNPQSYSRIPAVVSSTPNCTFTAVNVALSSASGTLDLYCDTDTATASLLPYDSHYVHQGRIEKQPVSVLTLDEYVATNVGFGRLLCLKIDTQGNDLSVIKGGEQVIAEQRPIIQTEIIHIPLYHNQCAPGELSQTLHEMNYHLYSLNNLHVTPEGRLAFCDAVFIPNELNIPVTQQFACIDDQSSFQAQIQTLTQACSERLAAIHLLDAEVQRLRTMQLKNSSVKQMIKRLKSWVQ